MAWPSAIKAALLVIGFLTGGILGVIGAYLAMRVKPRKGKKDDPPASAATAASTAPDAPEKRR